jgi:hypothetical protein
MHQNRFLEWRSRFAKPGQQIRVPTFSNTTTTRLNTLIFEPPPPKAAQYNSCRHRATSISSFNMSGKDLQLSAKPIRADAASHEGDSPSGAGILLHSFMIRNIPWAV